METRELRNALGEGVQLRKCCLEVSELSTFLLNVSLGLPEAELAVEVTFPWGSGCHFLPRVIVVLPLRVLNQNTV